MKKIKYNNIYPPLFFLPIIGWFWFIGSEYYSPNLGLEFDWADGIFAIWHLIWVFIIMTIIFI